MHHGELIHEHRTATYSAQQTPSGRVCAALSIHWNSYCYAFLGLELSVHYSSTLTCIRSLAILRLECLARNHICRRYPKKRTCRFEAIREKASRAVEYFCDHSRLLQAPSFYLKVSLGGLTPVASSMLTFPSVSPFFTSFFSS